MIVLDASLGVELLLADQFAPEINARIGENGGTIAVPEIFDLEVVQVFRRLLYQGHVSLDRTETALTLLATGPIKRFSHSLLRNRVWQLRHNLNAYDASYFALAETLNCALLTRDRKFLDVPGHSVKVDFISSH